MPNRRVKVGTGHNWGLWPVLLVLLLGVLVPTACVLWFMNAAISNEHLAVRQRLLDIYSGRAETIQSELEAYWAQKTIALQHAAESNESAANVFARLTKSGLSDSIVIRGATGQGTYPVKPKPEAPALPSTQWAIAEQLEHQLNRPIQAALAYKAIALWTDDVNVQARTLQAEARCLLKAGKKSAAERILMETLLKQKYRNATDQDGRFIAPSSMLLGLQLTIDSRDAKGDKLAKALAERLGDYRSPFMPSGQRVFLMQALRKIAPQLPAFPTQKAEELAMMYLQTPHLAENGSQLRPTEIDGVWQITARGKDRILVALFRDKTLGIEMQAIIDSADPIPGVKIHLVPPGSSQFSGREFLSLPIAQQLPDWQLKVHLTGDDPFTAAANRRRAVYLWTGSVGILIIFVLGLTVGGAIHHQNKLTRLKNDFLATVSHELKTPLASMRVLVDTLLEGRCKGQQQANDYFRLIAKENVRLTRLIDNFLTFSRMERNKKAFEFNEVDVNEIATAAVDSIRNKFDGEKHHMEMDQLDDLPIIHADHDALVTVILNLLDNAWKYSGDQKNVKLRTYSTDDSVCFEVSDNGIGMSRRAAKKIFNRFYQVDKTLSRSGGGCGLGLSIVKFILDAHGGTIEVTTQPGEGSTFTVKLPIVAANRKIDSENDTHAHGK